MTDRVYRTISAFLCFTLLGVFAELAHAVPETSGVRVTDVTPTSFSVVWLTDVAADPEVEVYADGSMAARITDSLVVTPMPSNGQRVSSTAKNKGIMKVRVSGLNSSTAYYTRTVTRDPVDALSVNYSPIQEVVTASQVVAYREIGGALQGFSNDLLSFPVYIRPLETEPEPALGDLVVLEREGSYSPLSAFVGDASGSDEGLIDLNNLFGADGMSLDLLGSEKIILRIYRAGGLSTLLHYRRSPQDMGMVEVFDPTRGPVADINLDGKIDDLDFEAFSTQYGSVPDDTAYNPDFNFVEDAEGKVDALEFSLFAREYGKTNVQ